MCYIYCWLSQTIYRYRLSSIVFDWILICPVTPVSYCFIPQSASYLEAKSLDAWFYQICAVIKHIWLTNWQILNWRWCFFSEIWRNKYAHFKRNAWKTNRKNTILSLKNNGKIDQNNGLLMASAGLSKVLVFKKELLTNHHMVLIKSDGFLLVFTENHHKTITFPAYGFGMVLINFFQWKGPKPLH